MSCGPVGNQSQDEGSSDKREDIRWDWPADPVLGQGESQLVVCELCEHHRCWGRDAKCSCSPGGLWTVKDAVLHVVGCLCNAVINGPVGNPAREDE